MHPLWHPHPWGWPWRWRLFCAAFWRTHAAGSPRPTSLQKGGSGLPNQMGPSCPAGWISRTPLRGSGDPHLKEKRRKTRKPADSDPDQQSSREANSQRAQTAHSQRAEAASEASSERGQPPCPSLRQKQAEAWSRAETQGIGQSQAVNCRQRSSPTHTSTEAGRRSGSAQAAVAGKAPSRAPGQDPRPEPPVGCSAPAHTVASVQASLARERL